MSLKGRKFRINRLDLNVVVQGTGPAVLLLHGFPDSAYLWRNTIPVLAESGYTVIAPDQRGFGDSDAPAGKAYYEIEQIVDDAVALLDDLGVDRARVVGHDLGALAGWTLTMMRPSKVDRLVAISAGHPAAYATAPIRQREASWFTVFFQLENVAEEFFTLNNWAFFRELVRHHSECDHWIEDLSRFGRLTAAMNWYRANFKLMLTGDFPRIHVPAMGIWGARDTALLEEQMTNSWSYVESGWHYERIEEAGHWLPLDTPERLNELLLDYLA